jgi:hypothetical protein
MRGGVYCNMYNFFRKTEIRSKIKSKLFLVIQINQIKPKIVGKIPIACTGYNENNNCTCNKGGTIKRQVQGM